MSDHLILDVLILGIVEGITEFLPISSTGHLILIIDIIGFTEIPGKIFEVIIQFGAILAICVVYAQRLWSVASTFFYDSQARRFGITVIIAFLPAGILGVIFHDIIKEYLFSVEVVCLALIVGGVILLFIEQVVPPAQITSIERIPFFVAFKIGLVQCLAMIPGTSRAGATIIGALLMGVDRRTAVEFSFFLAIPTMLGATVYDLYQNSAIITWHDVHLIMIGFSIAFITALMIVRTLIGFVVRYGIRPFAWYRIVLGTSLLILLS